MKRFKVNKKRANKRFNKTANRTHKKNMKAVPMRGGFRL